MKKTLCVAQLALALVCAAIALPASADDQQPQISEETPYVPSPTIVVETMLRMASVHANDFVIDLGSGDGRIIITAAQEYKARGFGVDYNARLVAIANDNARKAGVADRASFIEQDIFKTDLGKASVITMYLLPEYNAALKPKLLALKPGTRIVSHDYGIDDWEPDAKEKVAVPEKTVGLEKASWIYFWEVPAQVQGHWHSQIPTAHGSTDMELDLTQHNQKLEGTAQIHATTVAIERPLLKGNTLSFQLTDGKRILHFQGRVSAGQVSGRLLSGNKKLPWRARRLDPHKA